MNLVQPVLNGILMQKCFFAVFFEGHIAGKINTKQFKVFRRKLIQSFLQEGFFIAWIDRSQDQFQIQSGCLCIVAACCQISWNIPMRDSAVLAKIVPEQSMKLTFWPQRSLTVFTICCARTLVIYGVIIKTPVSYWRVALRSFFSAYIFSSARLM